MNGACLPTAGWRVILNHDTASQGSQRPQGWREPLAAVVESSSWRPAALIVAAFGAGAIQTELGEYRVAFLMAGLLCLVVGASFLMVGRALRPHVTGTQPATASAI